MSGAHSLTTCVCRASHAFSSSGSSENSPRSSAADAGLAGSEVRGVCRGQRRPPRTTLCWLIHCSPASHGAVVPSRLGSCLSTPTTEQRKLTTAHRRRLRSPGRRCRVRRAGGGGGRHLAPPGPQRPTLPPAPAPAPLSHHRGESEFAPRPAARGRPGGRPAGYRHTPAQHGLPPCPQQALAA